MDEKTEQNGAVKSALISNTGRNRTKAIWKPGAKIQRNLNWVVSFKIKKENSTILLQKSQTIKTLNAEKDVQI